MLRLLLLLAIAATLLPQASAQRHTFEAGYFVMSTGDTLRGEIALLPEIQAAQELRFRLDPQSEIWILTPWHVLEYGTDAGRRYVQRFIRPEEHRPEEPFFLLELVEGPPNLYSFAVERPSAERVGDPRRRAPYMARRYAIELADGTVRPLYIRHRFDPSVHPDAATDRQYLRVLGELFDGCPQAEAHLQHLRLRPRPLIAALEAYAACIGTQLVVAPTPVSRPTSDVRLDVGLRLAGGARTLSREEFQGEARTAYSVGLLAVLRPLIRSRGLSIPVELSLGYAGTQSEEVAEPFAAEEFSRSRVALHAGLRYEVPWGRAAPFVGAGVVSSRMLGDIPRYYYDQVMKAGVFFPRWESGYYLEVGLFAPLPPSRRSAIGLRYERLGLGEPHPLAVSDARWQSSGMAGFLSVSF